MRMIDRKAIFVILSCILFLCSCSNPKDEAITRLKNLYEDARQNSKTYDASQWDLYLEEYQTVSKLLGEFKFSTDEQKEVDRIKGRCSAYAREALVFKNSRELGNALQQTRGVFKGFSDTEAQNN